MNRIVEADNESRHIQNVSQRNFVCPNCATISEHIIFHNFENSVEQVTLRHTMTCPLRFTDVMILDGVEEDYSCPYCQNEATALFCFGREDIYFVVTVRHAPTCPLYHTISMVLDPLIKIPEKNDP